DETGLAPLDLTGGALICNVRHALFGDPNEDGLVIARELTIQDPPTDGLAELLFTADDTQDLTPGEYAYDVWFVDPDGNRSRVVKRSAFVLDEAVTDPAGPVTVPVESEPLALGPKGDKGDQGDPGPVGPAPSGSANDYVYLVSSGVAGARALT